MMGHREKLKDGDEQDAFTGWRHMMHWRTGALRAIKKRFNKRVRKNARKALKEVSTDE